MRCARFEFGCVSLFGVSGWVVLFMFVLIVVVALVNSVVLNISLFACWFVVFNAT